MKPREGLGGANHNWWLHLTGESYSKHDKYAKDTRTPPPTQMYKTEERPTKDARRELKDIVFTKAKARWVHQPHDDALVITV